MASESGWDEVDQELADIVFEMAGTAGFESRRTIFRRETHRAFEPEFFPALIRLLAFMSESNETGQEVATSVFTAICLEVRDFLAAQDPSLLSAIAVCTDLLAAAFAAALYPFDNLDPGVEFAKRVIRYQPGGGETGKEDVQQSAADRIGAEFDWLVEAADDRSRGDGPVFLTLGSLAQSWRQLPDMLRLASWLLSVCDERDQTQWRDRLRNAPMAVENPAVAVTALHLLERALRDLSDEQRASRAHQMLPLIFEMGVGVTTGAIDNYLTKIGPYFSPWEDEEEERDRLSAQGPSITLPTIRLAVDHLHRLSRSLDQPIAGEIAEKTIQLVFERATNLISGIVESASGGQEIFGGMVGDLLVAALGEHDPSVRALGAIYCGLKVVPDEVTMGQLQRSLVRDDDPLVRLAAAVVLQAKEGVMSESRAVAAGLLWRCAEQVLPELYAQVVATQARHVGVDGSGAAGAGVFAMALRPMLPMLIAQQDTIAASQDRPAAGGEGEADPQPIIAHLRQAEGLELSRIVMEQGDLWSCNPSVVDAVVELVRTLYPKDAAHSLRSTRESLIQVLDLAQEESLDICQGIARVLGLLAGEHDSIYAALREYVYHAPMSDLRAALSVELQRSTADT